MAAVHYDVLVVGDIHRQLDAHAMEPDLGLPCPCTTTCSLPLPKPSPSCPVCSGAGTIAHPYNPAWKFDSYTISTGRFLYRAGAHSLRPDADIEGVSFKEQREFLLARLPRLLEHGGWDQAFASDIAWEAVPYFWSFVEDGQWHDLNPHAPWLPTGVSPDLTREAVLARTANLPTHAVVTMVACHW
jgi:hypothetical protein